MICICSSVSIYSLLIFYYPFHPCFSFLLLPISFFQLPFFSTVFLLPLNLPTHIHILTAYSNNMRRILKNSRKLSFHPNILDSFHRTWGRIYVTLDNSWFWWTEDIRLPILLKFQDQCRARGRVYHYSLYKHHLNALLHKFHQIGSKSFCNHFLRLCKQQSLILCQAYHL
jgi:hypothetical protein